MRCPVLVIHGTDDRCQPLARGRRVAELTGGELVVLDGAGHLPHARDPVRVDRSDRRLHRGGNRSADADQSLVTWSQPAQAALYLSSPIGLGHARRDVAIAKELNGSVPTWRSTGAPSIRSPPCSKPRASRSTRRAAGSPTSPPTSRPSRASTTSTASRRYAAWTRSWWPTSWCSRRSSRRASTTS